MNKTRVCPICLHDKAELLHVQKFAEHFEHRIVSCMLCGFVYVNNTPPQKYYDQYYRQQSKYEGTRQHEAHDQYTDEIFNHILKKYIPLNASILDVGCSTGKLLNLIKKKGYKNLLGIDPAPECEIYARKNYNITVKTSTFENFETNKKYDLIIFSVVLEHLVDIRSAILKAYSLLKTDGMIYICVPNAGGFFRNFKEPFGEFSTEHINFFTNLSLSHLMSQTDNILLKNNDEAIISLWKKINIKKININQYIYLSQKKMQNINKTIELLPNKTIVWGVGALTQRLLETTKIKNKIFKFIDNNKNLIGKKINGIEVISPAELGKYNNLILISSYKFRKEISRDIRKNKFKNKILFFK